jgi:hypothetical protein
MFNEERYPYLVSTNFLEYGFESKGPSGVIRKIVRLIRISDSPLVFNLALTDFDERTGMLDDKRVSNNQDREKIFSTVLSIAIDFTNHFLEAKILLEGNTEARKRLFKISISTNLVEIEKMFIVYGFTRDGWEIFNKDSVYQALWVYFKNTWSSCSHFKFGLDEFDYFTPLIVHFSDP